MSKKILGLDIRQDSVSVVQIQETLQGNVVEKLIHLNMDDGIADGQQEPEDSLIDTTERPDTQGEQLLALLEDLSQDIDFSTADCFVSFPSMDMSFRNLSVPFKNKKKISQVLPFELEPVVPGSVDDLTMDFLMLPTEAEEDETQLVAAAVKSELLTSFESCLKRGGLNVQAIIPGGSATAEYLINACESHSDYLFMDMDLRSATLFLIRSNRIASIRSFAAGDAEGTGLNVSRTILAYCEQNDIDYQPNILFVTGPPCSDVKFNDILASTSGMKVESVDFIDSMGLILDDNLPVGWNKDLYQNALALTYAGMYGIKGLKLNERNVVFNKFVSEYKNQLIPSGVLLCLVILVFLVGTIYDGMSVSSTIAAYDRQMNAIYKEAFPSATKIIDPYSQMKAKVNEEKKTSAYTDSNAGNIRVIDLLNDISTSLPNTMDIELTRFVLGSDDLSISGITDNYETVNDMKEKLEKIDYFKSVAITSTTGGKVENKVNFKLKIGF